MHRLSALVLSLLLLLLQAGAWARADASCCDSCPEAGLCASPSCQACPALAIAAQGPPLPARAAGVTVFALPDRRPGAVSEEIWKPPRRAAA